MAARQTVFGPYKVIDIGVNGHVYEVVERIDNTSRRYHELRPRKTYLDRDVAGNQCRRLNKRWQEQLNPDECNEMMAYWGGKEDEK